MLDLNQDYVGFCRILGSGISGLSEYSSLPIGGAGEASQAEALQREFGPIAQQTDYR